MKSNPALQFTGIFTRVFACLILVTARPALDVNHDGMDDLWQARYNIAPFAGALDPDGDGRVNFIEAMNMTDPLNTPNPGLGMVHITDTHPADGLDDRWQARFGITAAQALEDPDEDGRTNLEEGYVGSDPFHDDEPWSYAGSTQGGGAAGGPEAFTILMPWTAPGWRYTLQVSDTLMSDSWSTAAVVPGENVSQWGGGNSISVTAATGGAERKFFRWFIDSPDTDGDGLGDWAEMQLGTGVMSIDTDGDGFSDSVEWGGGFNPVSAAHSPESVLPGGGVWLEHAAADTWDHVRWNKQAGPPVKYQTVADYGPDGDYDSSPWTESVPVMPAPQGLLPPEALSFGAWSAQWNQGGDFYEQPLYSYQVEQDMSPVPGAGSPYGGGRNSGARHAKFRLVTDYPRVHATTRVVMVLPEKWDAQYSPGLWQGTYAGPETPQYHTLQLPAGATTGPAVTVQLAVQTGVARAATGAMIEVEARQQAVRADGGFDSLVTVEELRLCRWFTAYPSSAPYTQAPGWVDQDPDRFQIRARGAGLTGASVTANLETIAPASLPEAERQLYSDAATAVTLLADGTGWYVSKPMILVSSAEDADETLNGIRLADGSAPPANNTADDRTHKAWPGGTLRLTFPAHPGLSQDIPVAGFKGTVKVQLAVVDGPAGYDKDTVLALLPDSKREAREIWAQHHVNMDFGAQGQDSPKLISYGANSKMKIAVDSGPQDSVSNNLFLFRHSPFDYERAFGLSDEVKEALDEAAQQAEWATGSVRVVFAPFSTANRDVIVPGGTIQRIPPGGIIGYTLLGEEQQVDYRGHSGTIIMSSDSLAVFAKRTLAHELGHVLLPTVSHSTPSPSDVIVPGDPDYPWHLLLLRRTGVDPLLSKRLRHAEQLSLFGTNQSPYLK